MYTLHKYYVYWLIDWRRRRNFVQGKKRIHSKPKCLDRQRKIENEQAKCSVSPHTNYRYYVGGFDLLYANVCNGPRIVTASCIHLQLVSKCANRNWLLKWRAMCICAVSLLPNFIPLIAVLFELVFFLERSAFRLTQRPPRRTGE